MASRFKPHEYQKRAIDFVLKRLYVERRLGAGLFLDPGLGKTGITLSAIEYLRDLGELGKVLVVAPLRVCHNVWPQEIRKWGFDLACEIVHGSPAQRERALHADADIYLINSENLVWLNERSEIWKAQRANFCTLVCDESTLFKNWTAKRTVALRQMLRHFRRRLILTGTPSPNGLQDLFAQMFILDDGHTFGRTLHQFRREYCVKGGFQGKQWRIRPDKREEIYSRIAAPVLRLDARDHLDLPPLSFNDIWVTLDEDAQHVYRELATQFCAELENGVSLTASSAGALYTKLKQLANGGGYDEDGEVAHAHNEKVDALKDLYNELGGKPMLVAYQYRHDLERLKAKWPKAPVIAGGTNQREVARIIERWNEGGIPVLLAQPQSMSHGLNLQGGGCANVVWFGLTDSLETYEQFNRRVYRQGVSGRVIIHRILAEHTVDEVIVQRVDGKATSQADFLEALKRWSGVRTRRTVGAA